MSYSQNLEDLRERAYDSILDRRCGIHIVVSIDIDYMDTKAASYSVWRAHCSRNAQGTYDVAVEDVAKDVVSAATHLPPLPPSSMRRQSSRCLLMTSFCCNRQMFRDKAGRPVTAALSLTMPLRCFASFCPRVA